MMPNPSSFFSVMYHYVRPKEQTRLRYLSVESFNEQLDYFQSMWGIITRSQWERYREGKELPKGVLLTFDDGLKDHIKTVKPILESRGLFAVFYVCTNPLQNTPLTVHLTHAVLASTEPERVWDYLNSIGVVREYEFYRSEKTKQAYSRHDSVELVKDIKRIFNWCSTQRNQNEVIREVYLKFSKENIKDFVESWYLNADDLKELLDADLEIGSHTCSHTLLSNLSLEQQEKELRVSKEILEELVTDPVKGFCFPYGGKHSYSRGTIHLLDRLGYTESFSVDHRTINEGQHGVFELPRFDCNFFPSGLAEGK